MSDANVKSRYGLMRVSAPQEDGTFKPDLVLVFNTAAENRPSEAATSEISPEPIFAMSELEDFIFLMNRIYPEGWSMASVAEKLLAGELKDGNPNAASVASEFSSKSKTSDPATKAEMDKYALALAKQKGVVQKGETAPASAVKVVRGPWGEHSAMRGIGANILTINDDGELK
jgi:hypothetical protein